MLDDEKIIAPDWCTYEELMKILNDTSWADGLITNNLKDE